MDIRPLGHGPQPAVVTPERNMTGSGTSAAASIPAVSAAAPVETIAAVKQPAAVPDMEQVKQAVQNLNKAMKSMSQDLEFSIDEDSNRTIVKIVDQQTKEIIRQLPSKEALEIAKALDKIQGLLIRQQA